MTRLSQAALDSARDNVGDILAAAAAAAYFLALPGHLCRALPAFRLGAGGVGATAWAAAAGDGRRAARPGHGPLTGRLCGPGPARLAC